ncbi:MAG: Holliday junction resolvase RuvX [Phycisphaerales bacterium]|nr:Holliday junction resolvase RuvX [Phycisphaerales bacterium]
MRYLGLDLGTKRTGVAVGDDETGSALPVAVVDTPDEAALMNAIDTQIRDHGPDAIVVGLPLNMDGTEGKPAEAARALADRISTHVHLDVHVQDERLTSDAARRRLAETGSTRGRRDDAIAAAIILEEFLGGRP